MINKVDILHERHRGNSASRTGEKSAGLLCMISDHHKTVVELGEYRLDAFAESFVSPCRRTPVFLIQPTRHLKCDVGSLKEIFLNLCTEVTFVTRHHAVVVFPLQIFQIMDVGYARRCHVIRMDDAVYSTDSVGLGQSDSAFPTSCRIL